MELSFGFRSWTVFFLLGIWAEAPERRVWCGVVWCCELVGCGFYFLWRRLRGSVGIFAD